MQSGFIYALEHGYDFVVQVDGDGQHDPGEIARLLERDATPTRPLDMVCGSRFLSDGLAATRRRSAAAPGSTSSRSSLSRIVGQRVSDPTSGFRLYNRRAIALFARDYPHDYPEVEAVLMLHVHRLRMREVPVRMFQRGGGVSSITSGQVASTTWSRCCWRSSSGSARRRPGRRARRRGAGRGRARDLMDDAHPDRRDRSAARSCSLIVLELVRRRRLLERYALLWLFSALVLLGLAIWSGAARARSPHASASSTRRTRCS